jgi:hypothetical protein
MDKIKFLLMVRKNSAYSFVRMVLGFFLYLSLLNIITLFAFSVPSAIWNGKSTFSSTATAINTPTAPNNTNEYVKKNSQSSETWETYPIGEILLFLLLRIMVGLSASFMLYFLYQSSLVLLDIGDATMHSAYVQHLAVVRASKD